jgi:hypothetical protein
LDGLLGPQDDLLSIACAHARDADATCQDVAFILFPSAGVSKDDALKAVINLRSQILLPQEAALFAAEYAHLIPEMVHEQRRYGPAARLSFLSFGKT